MPAAPAATRPLTLLTERAEVADLAASVRRHGLMGLDTEFVSERTYRPVLGLVQVATPDGLFLIDPLAPDEPDQPIWEAMADPGVLTVVHALYEEARFCLRRSGRLPGQLFDVQLGAAFNGAHYPIAYDKLVGQELRRGLGPSQSRTDWLKRPLTPPQLRYAADDVRWLLPLRERLEARMRANRSLGWFEEEMSQRLRELGRGGDRAVWRRLAGSGKLQPRSLAALRELAEWRVREAEAADLPLRWIVRDDLLVGIAQQLPRSFEELLSLRGGSELRRQHRAPILRAVQDAYDLPEPELPQRERPLRQPKPKRAALLFLEAVLTAACERYRVDPSLVGSSGQLRALIAWDANGRDPELRPPLLRGWRGKVCGEALLDALDGQVSLRLHDPQAAQPLAVVGTGTAR